MEMSRRVILRRIKEIQTLFPASVTRRMRLERVGDERLDELLARASTTFAPVFLPLFERDGDLYALHLVPGVSWEESAWVQLPHDAAEPMLVASAVKYLPAGLAVPPHWLEGRVAEIWPQVRALAKALPGARLPNKKPFQRARAERGWLLSQVDPGNGAASMAEALEPCESDEDAAKHAEQVWREAPDETYRLYAVALARAERARGDAAGPAREVLSREVAWGFEHDSWFIPPSDSGPEMLEHLRALALKGLEKDHPLALLRKSSYEDKKTGEQLRKVAEAWRDRGDERRALAQLRNGAAVVGRYGGLTRAWCERLAEQAERVEPKGLSAMLAQYAAKVFPLGP